MRKYLLVLFALLATSQAWAQTVSTCTTAQTIALQPQKYQPVYAISLTSGDTCNLTFQPILDPNASQSITLRFIQSSTAPYTGAISGGTWPSGVPTIPQAAGAQIFARCYIDTAGTFCFPIAPLMSPQVTVLSSGSGTYTTPPGTVYLTVEMVGGGGGGAGAGLDWTLEDPSAWSSSAAYGQMFAVTYGGQTYACLPGTPGDCPVGAEPDTSPTYWRLVTVPTNGSIGTGSVFGSLTASGGGGAVAQSGSGGISGTPGGGGTASGGDWNLTGNQGGVAVGGGLPAAGGSSPFGGAGGAGGASVAGWNDIGSGGGAGGYLRKAMMGPAASYSYVVGAGGAGGSAASCSGISGCGNAGQAGAGGVIIVTAYQWNALPAESPVVLARIPLTR